MRHQQQMQAGIKGCACIIRIQSRPVQLTGYGTSCYVCLYHPCSGQTGSKQWFSLVMVAASVHATMSHPSRHRQSYLDGVRLSVDYQRIFHRMPVHTGDEATSRVMVVTGVGKGTVQKDVAKRLQRLQDQKTLVKSFKLNYNGKNGTILIELRPPDQTRYSRAAPCCLTGLHALLQLLTAVLATILPPK